MHGKKRSSEEVDLCPKACLLLRPFLNIGALVAGWPAPDRPDSLCLLEGVMLTAAAHGWPVLPSAFSPPLALAHSAAVRLHSQLGVLKDAF